MTNEVAKVAFSMRKYCSYSSYKAWKDIKKRRERKIIYGFD